MRLAKGDTEMVALTSRVRRSRWAPSAYDRPEIPDLLKLEYLVSDDCDKQSADLSYVCAHALIHVTDPLLQQHPRSTKKGVLQVNNRPGSSLGGTERGIRQNLVQRGTIKTSTNPKVSKGLIKRGNGIINTPKAKDRISRYVFLQVDIFKRNNNKLHVHKSEEKKLLFAIL